MEWKVEVFVDYREKYIKEYFEKNKEFDNIVSIKNLEIGDIAIKINDKSTILIERKTISDLASSIQDGRLREQKFRISKSDYPHNNIIYLIEGDLDQKIYGRIDKKTLQGSIINTMIRDDYKIYRTKDTNETVYFLSRLINKIIKDKQKLVNFSRISAKEINEKKEENIDYCELVPLAKKSNLNPETFNKLVLLQIPGLSTRFIGEIQKKYPTIRDLIMAYEIEEKKQELLSEILIDTKTGKKRKIGLVMSKRIYEYFYPNVTPQ